jgi:hypothetical protein
MISIQEASLKAPPYLLKAVPAGISSLPLCHRSFAQGFLDLTATIGIALFPD